jgi:hypothetical protein
MRNIINLPLVDKLLIDLPRRVLDDFVDPPDVPHRLVPLFGGKDRVGLVLLDEGGGTDSDEEVDRGEHEFALPQLEHVAVCECGTKLSTQGRSAGQQLGAGFLPDKFLNMQATHSARGRTLRRRRYERADPSGAA